MFFGVGRERVLIVAVVEFVTRAASGSDAPDIAPGRRLYGYLISHVTPSAFKAPHGTNERDSGAAQIMTAATHS